MKTEEIVDAARNAGFSSSEIMHRLAAFKRLINSAAYAEREKFTNTQEFVTLPRAVAEQALEALFTYKPMVTGVTFQHGLDAMQALRAALEQPQNHVPDAGNMVPAGWKLVPVEPTQEMLDAYIHMQGRFSSARSDWAAMLAAAPQPPTTEDCSAVEQSQAEQKPRFFYDEEDALLWTPEEAQYGPEGMTALYTNPQPKREPLTDEQIIRMVNQAGWDAVNLEDGFGERIRRYTEILEATHNIK